MSPDFPSPAQRELLLDLAEESLAWGLRHQSPWPVAPEDMPAALRMPGATFVTLRLQGALRGCMGTIRAYASLGEDVVRNAYSAGFRDPRFSPLVERDYPDLSLSISLLSEPQRVAVATEAELLERLDTDRQGWILHCGPQRGLLLPSVWEALSNAAEFLACLKKKAQLPPDFWSEEVVVERFTAKSFGRTAEERCLRINR